MAAEAGARTGGGTSAIARCERHIPRFTSMDDFGRGGTVRRYATYADVH
jgi:hypothetical protein